MNTHSAKEILYHERLRQRSSGKGVITTWQRNEYSKPDAAAMQYVCLVL